MYKLPDELPIEERWSMVCADNMKLRHGLRTIIRMCELVRDGEEEATKIELIESTISIAEGVLR